jgi:hypothetical protein
MTENNGINAPLLPSSGEVYDGELAVNYLKDMETISFRNNSGEVVTISSDKLSGRKHNKWFKGEGVQSFKTLPGNIASGNYSIAEGAASEFSGISGNPFAYTKQFITEDFAKITLSSPLDNTYKTKTVLASTAATAPQTLDELQMVVSEIDGNDLMLIGNTRQLSASTGGNIYLYALTDTAGTVNGTIASGDCSHAEGMGTVAGGIASHAEGLSSSAIGDYSHAEGVSNIASGMASHAAGHASSAIGDYSSAIGEGIITPGGAQFSCGRYNSNASGILFSVGCGTDNEHRKDSFYVSATTQDGRPVAYLCIDGLNTYVSFSDAVSADTLALLAALQNKYAGGDTGRTSFTLNEIFNVNNQNS